MIDLRRDARDRGCLVQLPDICNGDRATTVLHHIRGTTLGGMGLKPPDIFGVHVCGACHAAIHRQTHPDLERDWLRLQELEGWLRTVALWHREGKIMPGLRGA